MENIKIELEKLFPLNTRFSEQFIEALALLYPFTIDEMEKYDLTKWSKYLIINPNIKWTFESIIKFKNDISISDLLNLNILWDFKLICEFEAELEECPDSYIIDLTDKYTEFSLDDYLYLNDKFDTFIIDEKQLNIDSNTIEKYLKYDPYIWDILSSNQSMHWDFELINKYRDKWNWEILCSNTSIKWTSYLINEFCDSINWNTLFKNSSVKFELNNLQYFIKHIGWTEEFEDRINELDELKDIIISVFSKHRIESNKVKSNKINYDDSTRIFDLPYKEKFLSHAFSILTDANFVWTSNFIDHFINEIKGNNYFYNISKLNNVDWSIELIEKYENFWNWNLLSSNKYLPWDNDLLEKFSIKWNWDILSEGNTFVWNKFDISLFKDRIKWEKFYASENIILDLDLIELLKDEIWWEHLCRNANIDWDEKLFITYIDFWILSPEYCYKIFKHGKNSSRENIRYPLNFFNNFIFQSFSREDILSYMSMCLEAGIPTFNVELNEIENRLRSNEIKTHMFMHNEKITFGKYKGDTIFDIESSDYNYLLWCIENIDFFSLNWYHLYKIQNDNYNKYKFLTTESINYIEKIIAINKLKQKYLPDYDCHDERYYEMYDDYYDQDPLKEKIKNYFDGLSSP